MNNEINLYCDESCHLENDSKSHMVLGCVFCPKNKSREINVKIAEIKARYGVNKNSEIKWTKVSKQKIKMYEEIIDYFFKNDDLFFRCVVAPKKCLNHKKFNQTHDDWYYKMYFETISFVMNPRNKYNIYIDIKDTKSSKKINKLREILSNNMYDTSHTKYIKQMQPIRSHEVQIMQITDILIGAIAYCNRGLMTSDTKLKLIELIKKQSGYSLTKTTPIRENKFNILYWRPNNG